MKASHAVVYTFPDSVWCWNDLLVEDFGGSCWPELKVRVKIGGIGGDASWSQEECCLLLTGAWPRSAWRAVWRASCVWPLLLTASVDAFLHPLPLSLSEIMGQPRIFHIVWIVPNVSLFQNLFASPKVFFYFFFYLFRLTFAVSKLMISLHERVMHGAYSSSLSKKEIVKE